MNHSPETALWQEVLLRQVEDALHGPSGVSGLDRRIRVIEAARAYLTTPSKQFNTLCLFAGMEPSAVITHMRKQIADAPTPAELAANHKVCRATRMKRDSKPKAKQIKRVDRLITFDGETLTMKQWADRTGISVANIASRLNQDWTIERALTQPIGKRNRGWGATGETVIEHGPGVVSNFGALEGTGGGATHKKPRI